MSNREVTVIRIDATRSEVFIERRQNAERRDNERRVRCVCQWRIHGMVPERRYDSREDAETRALELITNGYRALNGSDGKHLTVLKATERRNVGVSVDDHEFWESNSDRRVRDDRRVRRKEQ